jgi:hypothetical protein
MVLLFMSIAGIVLALAVGFCVLGIVIARTFRWRWVLGQGPGFSAVVGLSSSVLFLEVWNFFYPVNHASVLVLGILILLLVVIFWRTLLGTIRTWIQQRSILILALWLLLLLLVSFVGLGPSEHGHYDTGLYYLSSIRWAQQYPAIPGLANLHSRLGYNQSTFLMVAFLARIANLGLARACQVLNPLFVFVSGWAILEQVRLNLVSGKERRARLYAILLLSPLFFLATHLYLSAPTSDIAAAAVALAAALALFRALEEIFERNPAEAINWIFVLIFCAGLSAKLKLSYLVLGGTGIGMAAIALAFIMPRRLFSSWGRVGVLCAVILLPWMARGVVLTGYAFYPSGLLRFHTDWAVSGKDAEGERQWIYSWARMPGEDPDVVLKSNAWIGPWIERNAKEPENVFLALFVAMGLGFGLSSFFIPMDRSGRVLPVALVAQSLCAVIFWFKSAPDPRFGYAAILLCGVNGFYALTAAIIRASAVRSGLCAAIITLSSFFFIGQNQFPTIRSQEEKFPHGFPKADLEFKTTNSGLRIGVAIHEQAWDSGILVTPYFDPNLVLRGAGLREGFRIQREGHRDTSPSK